MMDALSLDQFDVFAVVAEEGSFAAAARRVNPTQSAITRAIQKWEDQSGIALFDRYRPVLTEAGKNLLPHIRRILADVENYRLHARQMARRADGARRIMEFQLGIPRRLTHPALHFSGTRLHRSATCLNRAAQSLMQICPVSATNSCCFAKESDSSQIASSLERNSHDSRDVWCRWQGKGPTPNRPPG